MFDPAALVQRVPSPPRWAADVKMCVMSSLQIMRQLMKQPHPNIVQLKHCFYSSGEKVRDALFSVLASSFGGDVAALIVACWVCRDQSVHVWRARAVASSTMGWSERASEQGGGRARRCAAVVAVDRRARSDALVFFCRHLSRVPSECAWRAQGWGAGAACVVCPRVW